MDARGRSHAHVNVSVRWLPACESRYGRINGLLLYAGKACDSQGSWEGIVTASMHGSRALHIIRRHMKAQPSFIISGESI